MAQDQTIIELTSGSWIELTNADVTAVTFQVLEGSAYFKFSTGTTPTKGYGLLYQMGQGESNKAIVDIVNAVGLDRLFARRRRLGEKTVILIDHA